MLKNRNKKKILLMSDDLRMSSGVGTMSREIVMGTIDHYDWVQLGGAIKHPEDGKIVDMKDAVKLFQEDIPDVRGEIGIKRQRIPTNILDKLDD